MVGDEYFSQIIWAILCPAMILNGFLELFIKSTKMFHLKSGSITPALTEIPEFNAKPDFGAILP